MRECQFVKSNNIVWVPYPDSWLGGWSRQRWLESYFKNNIIRVASCEVWARLYFENKVYVLSEDCGTFSEKVIKKKKKDNSKKKKKNIQS